MDLQVAHLRTLQAIVRHGSFSRAAQALNLTQPAVSMQVRHLERALGLPLLERVGKRAFPTRAGEVLLAHADRALRELEAGVEHVQGLRGVVAGRVRLGTSASISIYLLPPVLRRFRARYPDTEIVIVTGNAAEITRAIVANELDVGVVSLPVRDRELSVTPFFRDELLAITSRGAPIGPPAPPRRSAAPRRSRVAPRTIDAPTLAQHPLILFEAGATLRRVIDGWFHQAGVAPRAPMEMGNTEAIKKLVEAGLGLSVTSWFSVKREVRDGLLTAIRLTPPLERQIGLVRRRDKPRTPALDAFVAALEDLRRTLSTRRPRRA
ncbi:MAG TPA: LysR substrate-binding domain-containing protein [Methylomirabilota bacterium]|nr:LysR substrate-binding domain-containing protein [Methylomirabilota bacterium]